MPLSWHRVDRLILALNKVVLSDTAWTIHTIRWKWLEVRNKGLTSAMFSQQWKHLCARCE